MVKIDDWKETVKLPLFCKSDVLWNYTGLELKIAEAVKSCAEYCLEANRGSGIAIMLSGGISSSFILAKIRKNLGTSVPVIGFTIGNDQNYPDIRHSRMLGKLYRLVHHEILPTVESRAYWKIQSAELLEKDFYSFAGQEAAYGIFHEVWRSGLRAIITGHGAECLLGGYPQHQLNKGTEKQRKVFETNWRNMPESMLMPLLKVAEHFSVELVFPYLQRNVIQYVGRIPFAKRSGKEGGMLPVRFVARDLLPPEIISREELRLWDALSFQNSPDNS